MGQQSNSVILHMDSDIPSVYFPIGKPEEGGTCEFATKKCKKEKVTERYRERTDHYIKPSVKKKIKRQKAIRERQKLLRKKDKKLFR